jgi:type I restriction enzyme M protein
MLIKDKISAISLGNTLSDDQLWNERFDYCLSNPPFGVDWKRLIPLSAKNIKRATMGVLTRFAESIRWFFAVLAAPD